MNGLLSKSATLLLAFLAFLAFALPADAGTLLVSSINTNDVKRFDANTGAFLDTFASGGGLSAPTGLAFGPDGNLYVGSANTDQVKRFDGITGALIDNFATGGGLDAPFFLTFSPNDVAAVPEPGALVMGATGIVALAGA